MSDRCSDGVAVTVPSAFRVDAKRIEEPGASALVAFGLNGVAIPDLRLPACVSANAGRLKARAFLTTCVLAVAACALPSALAALAGVRINNRETRAPSASLYICKSFEAN